jgi:hypothetical protein
MSRNLLSRLQKLERTTQPPQELVIIPIIAADDPEAERLIAEHEDRPGVTLIILTGVYRAPGAIVP